MPTLPFIHWVANFVFIISKKAYSRAENRNILQVFQNFVTHTLKSLGMLMGFGHSKNVTKKHEGREIFSKPQLVAGS